MSVSDSAGRVVPVPDAVETVFSAGPPAANLSTHDPDQAFALGADVLFAQGGRTVAQGRPEAALTESGRMVCAPGLAPQSAASNTSDALITT